MSGQLNHKQERNYPMKKAYLFRLLTIAVSAMLLTGSVHAQSGSSSLSCPPNYALSIDPPPPLTDDPANPDVYKPQSAAEKQQAEEQARANEMARWHCVPLDTLRNQQPKGAAYDQ
jgi:hypothetical protein